LTPFVNRTVPPSDRALNSDQYQLKNAFNFNMLKLRLLAQPTLAMISPGAGIGVELAMSDALYALCSVEAPRDQVADWVVQRLAEDGQQTGIAGASETKAIAEALELFRTTRLPKLLELGILAPAG